MDANPSMQHLQQLLGRSQLRSNSKSTTTGELDNAMKQLAEHYFEPDQHDPQDIADNDEASGEDSDDDPEVDTLLDHALTFLTQTCSCVCAGLCSFEQAQLAAQRIPLRVVNSKNHNDHACWHTRLVPTVLNYADETYHSNHRYL